MGTWTQSCFWQHQERDSSSTYLRYYDPKKETILQTDASIKGLGTCLLQDGHPIYFASKLLQDVEHRYVTIELETLAVAWAMEKFHISYMHHILP